MLVEYATADDIHDVAMRMRKSDYLEFIGMTPFDSREALADSLVDRFRDRLDVIVASFAGERVAVGGMIEHRPNVVTLLFFATDRFEPHARPLSKLVRNLFRGAKSTGVHRIEAVSIEGHTDAHRWIRWLGLEAEGPLMLGYGKGGEAYQQFAWVAGACSPAS